MRWTFNKVLQNQKQYRAYSDYFRDTPF